MWISRKEYNRLLERIGDLERATRVPCLHSDVGIGQLVYMLMQHLNLYFNRQRQKDELVKRV